MGYKEEIYELLQNEDLSVKQISEKLRIKPGKKENENNIRVYINRLVKKGLIESIGKNERDSIYRAITSKNNLDIQLLKKFIPIFLENDLDIELSNEEYNRVKKIYEDVRK